MSADSLAMMPWFPRDFIAATLGWRLLERALYRCLLDAQWELGELPTDEEELARIAGATPSEFAQAWPRVKSKFTSTASGLLRNERLEEHRRKALEIKDKKRRAGSAGGIASGISRSRTKAELQAELQAEHEAEAKRTAISAEANDEAKSKPPSPSPSPSLEEKTVVELALDDSNVSRGTAAEVFKHWKRVWNHPKAVFDSKRRKRIEARLKDYTVEQLCEAISGYRNSPWHCGTDPNGNGTVYDSLDTLLQDSDHVEKGLRYFANPPSSRNSNGRPKVAI